MINIFSVLANFVPAAAVKRGGLTLLKMIGRKGFVGRKLICYLKSFKFNLKKNNKKFSRVKFKI